MTIWPNIWKKSPGISLSNITWKRGHKPSKIQPSALHSKRVVFGQSIIISLPTQTMPPVSIHLLLLVMSPIAILSALMMRLHVSHCHPMSHRCTIQVMRIVMMNLVMMMKSRAIQRGAKCEHAKWQLMPHPHYLSHLPLMLYQSCHHDSIPKFQPPHVEAETLKLMFWCLKIKSWPCVERMKHLPPMQPWHLTMCKGLSIV